jgi:hypothetical protein
MGLAQNKAKMKMNAANICCTASALAVLLMSASEQTRAQEVLTTAEVTSLDGNSGPLGPLAAVRVKLRFTDIETKEPFTENLEPNAWFRVRKPGDQHCSGEIRVAYAQNNVNLTSQLIVTANEDNTLTFVDPLMKLGAANIFSIAKLPERPIEVRAFAGEILLLLHQTGAVMAVNPSGGTRLLLTGLAKPAALAVLGSNIAVADDNGIVLLSAAGKPVSNIRIPHKITRLELVTYEVDSRIRAITSGIDGSVTAVDFGSKAILFSQPSTTSATTFAMVKSGVVVLDSNAKSASLRYWRNPSRAQRVELPFAADGIAANASQELAVVWSNTEKKIALIDAAQGIITSVQDTKADFADVRISGNNAFFNHNGNAGLTLVDFGPVIAGNGEAAQLEIPVNSNIKAPSLTGTIGDGGQILVLPPGGSAVLTYGNSQSTAPMTTTPLKGAQVLGLFMLERGFKKNGPNSYETVARLPPHGPVELVTTTGLEGTQSCFGVVSSAPPLPVAPKLVSAIDGTTLFNAQNTTLIRLEGEWPKNPRTIRRLPLLVHSLNGAWRLELIAENRGDGTFAADIPWPTIGQYAITVNGYDAAAPLVVAVQ